MAEMSVPLKGSALKRIKRKLHYEHDGTILHHTQQDVEPILDLAKYMRNEQDGQRIGENNIGIHAALIPITILYGQIWRGAKTEAEREERLVAWLNDSDNSGFRSWKGRVGKPR